MPDGANFYWIRPPPLALMSSKRNCVRFAHEKNPDSPRGFTRYHGSGGMV
jgi:hypothetical protein